MAIESPSAAVARGLMNGSRPPRPPARIARTGFPDPGRARPIRPGWQDRPDPRQRAHVLRPGVDGPRPDRLPLAHPSTWPDRTGRDRAVPGMHRPGCIHPERGGLPPVNCRASRECSTCTMLPRTPALRVDRSRTWRNSPGRRNPPFLSSDPAPPDLPDALHLWNSLPKAASQRLYSILHECNALYLDVIIIVMPPDQPGGEPSAIAFGPGGETGGGLIKHRRCCSKKGGGIEHRFGQAEVEIGRGVTCPCAHHPSSWATLSCYLRGRDYAGKKG